MIIMKRGTITFIAGVLTGAAMFGGTVAGATGFTAYPSTDRVYAGGSEIQCDVYKIGGNNYFKLRDIAAAVDFSVVYDGTDSRVFIDASRGYDANEQYVPQADSVTAVTLDEMREEIIALTNAERNKAGLPELAVLPALMDCACARKSG